MCTGGRMLGCRYFYHSNLATINYAVSRSRILVTFESQCSHRSGKSRTLVVKIRLFPVRKNRGFNQKGNKSQEKICREKGASNFPAAFGFQISGRKKLSIFRPLHLEWPFHTIIWPSCSQVFLLREKNGCRVGTQCRWSPNFTSKPANLWLSFSCFKGRGIPVIYISPFSPSTAGQQDAYHAFQRPFAAVQGLHLCGGDK